MDPFFVYLTAINVATLLVFAVVFLSRMRKPGPDGTAAISPVLAVFPIAGGAVGMLLALFISTGLSRGRRMSKNNVAWWFIAIICLVVWVLVLFTRAGFVSMDTSVGGIVSGWDLGKLTALSRIGERQCAVMCACLMQCRSDGRMKSISLRNGSGPTASPWSRTGGQNCFPKSTSTSLTVVPPNRTWPCVTRIAPELLAILRGVVPAHAYYVQKA